MRSRRTCNTGITRCNEDGDTLHAELHEFVALSLLVGSGKIGLLTTVRDADDVGRLVDSTLQLTLVATWSGIWVWWIQGAVSSLAECRVCAVRSIDSVQEVVEKALIGVVCLVDRVICLEENGLLGVDQRVGNLEVEVGLGA